MNEEEKIINEKTDIESMEKPKKNHTWIVVLLIVLIVIGLNAFLLLRNDKKLFNKLFNKDNNTTEENTYILYSFVESKDGNVYASKNNIQEGVLGKYSCKTNNCEVLNTIMSGRWVLIRDETLFAYNYINKEIVDLSEYNEYYNLELIESDGLIYSETETENYKYYNIPDKKIVIETKNPLKYDKELNILIEYDENNKELKYYDCFGYIALLQKEGPINIENTKVYYIIYQMPIAKRYFKFYTEDGKELYDGKKYDSYKMINNKLVISNSNTFQICDINGTIESTSQYKKVSLNNVLSNENLILVIDNNNVVKFINTNEEEIYKITDYGTDFISKTFVYALSNTKVGDWITIFVEDKNASAENSSEYRKDLNEMFGRLCCDDNGTKINYLENHQFMGYNYYYNLKTKETLKYASDETLTGCFR